MNARMLKAVLYLVLSITICAVLIITPSVKSNYQTNLVYQDRGDRYEGIKGTPVSDRIELISAVVDYKETGGGTPENFKLKFYLNEQDQVFITVRELDNKHNYWMDKIRPRPGWKVGFGNEFQWPTQEVIKPLKDIQLDGLGAVAQLRNDDPVPDVRVAPCILYYSQPPNRVAGYLFTFKIGRRADVTYSFSKDEDNSSILETRSFPMLGQRPRTVSWKTSNLKEGWYRLTINVTYSNNNEEVIKTVRFYHRSIVR